MNVRETWLQTFRAQFVVAGVVMMIAVAVSGCDSEIPAPQQFPPLSYSYLLPLRLNVANIEIDDSWTPRPGLQRSPSSPLYVRSTLSARWPRIGW